jgi:hypothetical protein
MQFVNAITRRPGEVARVHRLWQEGGDPRNPFAHLLTTPVGSTEGQLRAVRALVEASGARLTFDSGGFYVQTGRLSYDALYGLLLDVYRAQPWAHWYVLPDWVPRSTDSEDLVWEKVRYMVRTCRLFLRDLPTTLRERAIGVVHGRTPEQIEFCLEAYRRLGVRRVGFGSFATSGRANSVNFLSRRAFGLLARLAQLARDLGLHLHAFGIGGPASLPVLRACGVQSFDSVSWMKTAGYGNIHFPFSSTLSATARDYGVATLTRARFHELQALTGHRCPFCASFDHLRAHRDHRMMHNLTVLLDTLDTLRRGDPWRSTLQALAPRYAKLLA